MIGHGLDPRGIKTVIRVGSDVPKPKPLIEGLFLGPNASISSFHSSATSFKPDTPSPNGATEFAIPYSFAPSRGYSASSASSRGAVRRGVSNDGTSRVGGRGRGRFNEYDSRYRPSAVGSSSYYPENVNRAQNTNHLAGGAQGSTLYAHNKSFYPHQHFNGIQENEDENEYGDQWSSQYEVQDASFLTLSSNALKATASDFRPELLAKLSDSSPLPDYNIIVAGNRSIGQPLSEMPDMRRVGGVSSDVLGFRVRSGSFDVNARESQGDRRNEIEGDKDDDLDEMRSPPFITLLLFRFFLS